MKIFTHVIADIVFRTECDNPIFSLVENNYNDFLSDNTIHPHAVHYFLEVDTTQYSSSPLSDQEYKKIVECIKPEYLGRGTLIIPPLTKKNLENQITNNPLLNSSRFRASLAKYADYSNNIGLIDHIFSLTLIDYKNKVIEVFYPSERKDLLLDSRMEVGLRRVFSTFLPEFSALLMHSVGIIRGDRTALFVAKDEGGKTTIAMNSSPELVLCDDLNIVRKQNADYTVYPSPWGQITNSGKSSKLGGMFLLEKAEHFDIIPINPVDMFEHCWNEYLIFNSFLPRKARINAFMLLSNLCHEIPVYRLQFPKNQIDWIAIDNCLK